MSDHQHGAMDIEEQAATFHAFIALTKWGSLALVAALVPLVIWFCTTAGFVPGAITGVVVAVGGILLLRDKPASH
jgi:hypothetical protein